MMAVLRWQGATCLAGWEFRDARYNQCFEGHILALTSITLNTGANILDGSAWREMGAVTLDDNSITNCVSVSLLSAPEPSTMTLALVGGAVLGVPPS